MLEITTKIDNTVKKYNMLSSGDTVVVGVSGGADSMLLLYYLLHKRDELDLKLIVANVEHGIRGEESIKDSLFVKKYCCDNNVQFEQLSIDAETEASKLGLGVEEYSRNRRYEFFNSFNADKIATAHNKSDNVETVLFRLARGTSIKGCCGIPAVRKSIIRPLIYCSSTEIRNACKELGLEYVIDSTNSDNKYTRNQIRNNIIPLFRDINSNFENNVSRFIDNVNDDEDCLNQLANECFDNSFKNNTLLIDKLNKYHKSIIKRTLIKYFSLYDLSLDEVHLNEIYSLVQRPSRIQIKGCYFAISDKKRIRVAKFQQSYDFEDFTLDKRVISRTDFLNNRELFTNKYHFYCDYDKIAESFSIRAREEGDSISPANRNCTKSLKKLYNELQIPVEDRENIPIIIDKKGIIGIYGICNDERVKIDNNTINVLLLEITLEDKY